MAYAVVCLLEGLSVLCLEHIDRPLACTQLKQSNDTNPCTFSSNTPLDPKFLIVYHVNLLNKFFIKVLFIITIFFLVGQFVNFHIMSSMSNFMRCVFKFHFAFVDGDIKCFQIAFCAC